MAQADVKGIGCLVGLAALALALHAATAAGTSAADTPAYVDPAPDPNAELLDRFIDESRLICLYDVSDACVDLGFDFADLDADGGLAPAELFRIRAAVWSWIDWREDQLLVRERNAVRLGLWAVDMLGLARLHDIYDLDGDGLVSRSELLVDVTLDERPLGEVLTDPTAVDRRGIARRLGAIFPLLERALPPG